MNNNATEILAKLKDAGYKFTGKRQMAVELFVNNRDKYLSAKEVHEHVRSRYERVSFDTIYRTLNTLLEQGVIEPMEFNDEAAKYRLKCGDEHHHHLVCVGCGLTQPLEDCPVDEILDHVGKFEVLNHRFEVYGYCEDCQSKHDLDTH